jgi:Adenylate and Guanylate cyclase catalytic domain
VRDDLPSGRVTFLFTDIDGSTRLLREPGAVKYAVALADHRRLLREAFARHGGIEVDTQGDALFWAFPREPEALEAAREGQEVLPAELSGSEWGSIPGRRMYSVLLVTGPATALARLGGRVRMPAGWEVILTRSFSGGRFDRLTSRRCRA